MKVIHYLFLMEEFDYRLLDAFISVDNVDFLMALCQLSLHQKEKGDETRQYLEKALPVLCDEKGLPFVDSFRPITTALLRKEQWLQEPTLSSEEYQQEFRSSGVQWSL